VKSTTLPARTRTWTFRPPERLGLGVITEVCPQFCRADHTHDMDGTTHPTDIWHQQVGPSMRLRLSESEDEFEQWRVMEAQLTVRPYSPNPAEQVPHVDVEYVEGVWTGAMGPEQLADFIGQLDAHVDRLRIVHAQLVKALAEHRAAGR
jgi:hypothetical protein